MPGRKSAQIACPVRSLYGAGSSFFLLLRSAGYGQTSRLPLWGKRIYCFDISGNTRRSVKVMHV
jgi:hypothetical protein